MSPFSGFQRIAESGQKSVQTRHFVHLVVSLTGVYVFQSPVKYVVLALQHTPA